MSIFPQHRNGFSLVEILVAVAVIGVLASVTVPLVTGVPDAAKKEKLEQDVAVVNNAIDSYLAAGGAPANLTADNVLAALKSRVYGGMPAEMMGPQGPFLDPTVTTNASDFAWSALFTTEPRPRFYVMKNTAGVVFGKGSAMVIGGVAERPDEARASWLWTYASATPPPESASFTPLAVDTGRSSTNTPVVATTLGAPGVFPGSTNGNLWNFPLPVMMTNTNPPGSSRIYYKVGTGNFSLFEDGTALSISPDTTLTAVCVSLDPSRYYNSTASSNYYGVTPLQLAVTVTVPSSVTYAQAGGLIQGVNQQQPTNATIVLRDTSGGAPDDLLLREGAGDRFIPPAYLKNAYFFVRYTTDGSDPLTNGTIGPSFDGFFSPVSVPLGLASWGTNSTITVRAMAVSSQPVYFTSSGVSSGTATVAPTPLPLTIAPANPIGLPFQVQLNHTAPVPVGLRKFYRTDGGSPLTSVTGGLVQPGALAYTSAVPSTSLPNTPYRLTAQATGPAGFEQWFSSQTNFANYAPIKVLDTKLVGANISGGDVNGSFVGSIFVSAPANLGIFNAGGTITRGNLYLPGLPEIEVTGQGNRGTTIVAQGVANYSGAPPVSRSIIAGKEYTATGQLADPQLDTRQIVAQAGGTYTNAYTVKITPSTFIEGKIYRNVDVPTNAVTVPLRTATNRISGNFDGLSTNTAPLASGFYSNNISLDRTNAVIRLGSANTNQITQYIFSGGNWSKGRIEIVGRVQILFDTGFVNSGVVFGSSSTVDSLAVYVTASNADVEFKSGGIFYGSLWLTNGTPPTRNDVTVGNNGAIYGSITAEYLTVAPGGIVNVE
jgi:prepilin-type N-terminal cleavage/methylation domain-containing protein